MFKGNNKDNMTSFWCLWTYFIPFSCVSIGDFEQVHNCWSCFKNKLNSVDLTRIYSTKGNGPLSLYFGVYNALNGFFYLKMFYWCHETRLKSSLVFYSDLFFLSLYSLSFHVIIGSLAWWVNFNSSVVENINIGYKARILWVPLWTVTI